MDFRHAHTCATYDDEVLRQAIEAFDQRVQACVVCRPWDDARNRFLDVMVAAAAALVPVEAVRLPVEDNRTVAVSRRLLEDEGYVRQVRISLERFSIVALASRNPSRRRWPPRHHTFRRSFPSLGPFGIQEQQRRRRHRRRRPR